MHANEFYDVASNYASASRFEEGSCHTGKESCFEKIQAASEHFFAPLSSSNKGFLAPILTKH